MAGIPEAAGLFTVVVIALRVVERIVDKRLGSGKAGLSQRERGMLQKLYDQHNRYDAEGQEVWACRAPRLYEPLKEVTALVRESNAIQARSVEILDRIERRWTNGGGSGPSKR